MPEEKVSLWQPMHEVEVKASMERAHDSLRAASLLSNQGFYDVAVSRAYYAAFYATSALLLRQGRSFGKHSGILAAFQKDFVKTGLVEVAIGKSLGRLYELRNVADYGESRHVSIEEAERSIEEAERIIEVILRLIERSADAQ